MRALLAIALVSLACSSEGSGDGKKGTFAGNPGGPSAFGNGASAPAFGENGGSASAFGENGSSSSNAGDPTRACSGSADCPAPAVCTETTLTGFCIVACTLSGSGDVESGVCPAGLLCLRNKAGSSNGICLRSCSSEVDCPTLTGLTTSCAEAPSGQHFCVWLRAKTESSPPSAGSSG
ncbi:MAG: hypothetical protein ACXWUE_27365 [Polyangiales bacterium]